METRPNITVAIVYHSGYGHTERLAQAAARGAEGVAGTEIMLLRAEEAQANLRQLDGADAIIFGAPTYMGSPSAVFKGFMEASAEAWIDQLRWRDKLAAGFTSSQCLSGDKLNTLITLAVFAMQHGMQWVGLDLYDGWRGEGSGEQLNRLGSWIGAMAQCDRGLDADHAPPVGDLRTAEHLGRRVAALAHQWVAGRQAATLAGQ